MDYSTLKRRVLEKYFSRANEMQKKAIFKVDGAVLIIAGAGSGKTTVLCNRIANMILFGNAYNSNAEKELSESDIQYAEDFIEGRTDNADAAENLSRLFGVRPIEPWRILAVTFTNKAAAELKERLENMGVGVDGIWAATFHSACVKILRRDIKALGLGYDSSFTIYDTDDSQKVIKMIMKELNISDKVITAKTVQNMISRAKDKLITPDTFGITGKNGGDDFTLSTAQKIYKEYESRLRSANALDFDDIIMLTVKLFRSCPDVLSHWQDRFSYIMVDEYQDTNKAQYKLISLLSGRDGNLCVVGDEDQSIYRFRGATIENILSFEDEFDAEVIKLEQNYRSTKNILEAANAVIKNNTQHKDKNLWCTLGDGEKITLNRFTSEQEEGSFVAGKILDGVAEGRQYSDHVILYRNNAQSRTIELSLAKSSIPYRIIGGVRFYERKEIKDIIAYLSVISNNYDISRLARIINEPTRGIGTATQDEIARIADGMGMSQIDVMMQCQTFPTLEKKAKALMPFAENILELGAMADDISSGAIIDEILDRFGYREALKKEGIEGEVRLDNINELKSNIITFASENEEASLSQFLEQVALVTDLDSYEEQEDKVVLMTMHAAKGLEFDTVFVIGAEENIFPSYASTMEHLGIEEERRLAYVAITRAKRKLYFTCAKSRMLYGNTLRNKVSRFVSEIPPKYMEYIDNTAQMKPASPISSVSGGGTLQGGYSFSKPAQKNTNYLGSQRSVLASSKPKTEAVSINISVGDRIRHKTFGEGTVISSTPMGGDALLEIAFDTQGTKKIAAKFAKLEKI